MDKHELACRLQELMASQMQLLSALREYLTDADWVGGRAFQLPTVDPDIAVKDEQYIETTSQEGGDALYCSLHAWAHLYAGENESTRFTYRLPGAIQVTSADEDLIRGIVGKINAGRTEFKKLVTGNAGGQPLFRDAEERHEFLHSRGMFPMLITLHLYRHIHLLDDKVRSISFNWACKPVIAAVTRDEVLASLERSSETPPRHLIDPTEWMEQVRKEIAVVSALPRSVELRTCRPAPVQPQAWSYPNRKMVVASTPILILGSNPVAIGALGDYNPLAPKRAPTRPRMIDSTPIVERLWLYKKAPN